MENAIEIKFNNRLYSLGSVRTGIADYRDVADFRVKRDRKNILVTMHNFDASLSDTLADEFANYVLFIEGNARSW
jgi:hypothetical protein